MTKPSPEKSRLIAAICDARAFVATLDEDDYNFADETGGLSVARHIFPGMNQRRWTVSFSSRPDRFLTVLKSQSVLHMTDAEIAEMILNAWDTDWDDVLKDRPAGDYRVGSSDFKQRNQ